jgi:hypothetical protein
MQDNNYNGIVEDPRTDEDKAKDFIHEELFASAPAPVWEERETKKFPIFNQDGSSMCVAFATAKILGIDEVYEGRGFVHLSPRDIYTRRQNQDSGGMWLPDALNIARKHGATLESLVPSENIGETAANSKTDITPETDKIAERYKSAGFVSLPIDVDAIAAITTMGKGILLGHRFDYDEWTDMPTVNPNSKLTCGHGTAGVDNVLLNGKKYIVMDDSWGPHYAKFGQRYLSQEWLKARCFYAGYTLNFHYVPDNNKPQYIFKSYLKRGERNADIVALQNILKFEGMFPTNVESTGLYGPVTQRGVLLFQNKYLQVNNKGKQVGPATIAKLNELYGA